MDMYNLTVCIGCQNNHTNSALLVRMVLAVTMVKENQTNGYNTDNKRCKTHNFVTWCLLCLLGPGKAFRNGNV